jgi:hypothetical protein
MLGSCPVLSIQTRRFRHGETKPQGHPQAYRRRRHPARAGTSSRAVTPMIRVAGSGIVALLEVRLDGDGPIRISRGTRRCWARRLIKPLLFRVSAAAELDKERNSFRNSLQKKTPASRLLRWLSRNDQNWLRSADRCQEQRDEKKQCRHVLREYETRGRAG